MDLITAYNVADVRVFVTTDSTIIPAELYCMV